MNRSSLIGLLIALVVWAGLTGLGVVRPLFIPSPGAVAGAWLDLLRQGDLLRHAGATLYRTLAAFGLSVVFGLLLGVALGAWRRAYDVAEIVFDFLRSLPSPALIPVAMLLLGLGDAARIAVAAFTCTLINAIQAVYGIRGIPSRRVAAAQLLGARRLTLVRLVLFPSILPSLVAGWRITLSLSLIIVVVTEMFIGTRSGLGMQILDYHMVFRIPEMYALIVTVGGMGYVLNKMVETSGARVAHWSGRV